MKRKRAFSFYKRKALAAFHFVVIPGRGTKENKERDGNKRPKDRIEEAP